MWGGGGGWGWAGAGGGGGGSGREGGQEGVGLEVNANHIRSVRSGRVRGVCRALHAGSRHQGWQIDILDEQDRLCCSSRLTTAVV